jgi:hypothetical protein
MLNSVFRSDLVHFVVLEASYFRTLYQLHAANALGAFSTRTDVFGPNELRAAAWLIPTEMYGDAQRLLTMTSLISSGTVAVTW